MLENCRCNGDIRDHITMSKNILSKNEKYIIQLVMGMKTKISVEMLCMVCNVWICKLNDLQEYEKRDKSRGVELDISNFNSVSKKF